MEERSDTAVVLVVDARCDATDVHDALARLQVAMAGATPERPVRLDASDPKPTAFCLQLLIAARKSLDRRGAFAGFGPAAQAALSSQ